MESIYKKKKGKGKRAYRNSKGNRLPPPRDPYPLVLSPPIHTSSIKSRGSNDPEKEGTTLTELGKKKVLAWYYR